MTRLLSVLGVVTLAATINLQAQYNFTTLSVPGALETRAWGISGNNIVGYYTGFTGTYGFLYDGSSYATLPFTYAQGVSGGNIVGYYLDTGSNYQGFLATPVPVPEPSALGLLAAGVSTLLVRRRLKNEAGRTVTSRRQ